MQKEQDQEKKKTKKINKGKKPKKVDTNYQEQSQKYGAQKGRYPYRGGCIQR